MAYQTPKVLGNFGLTEAPDSPQVRTEATKTSIIRIYEGTWSQVAGAAPSIGEAFADSGANVVVVNSFTQRLPGGKGRLTIEFETAFQTTYEVEWVEIDRLLILNPLFWSTDAGDLSNGTYPLTWMDRSMIEKWEAEPDPVYKLAFLYTVPYDNQNSTLPTGAVPQGTVTIGTVTYTCPTTINGVLFNVFKLSDNAIHYAKKRLKGEESYRLWAPVVRQTSESILPPSVNPCGLTEQPPSDAGAIVPAGYKWQRSAQRVVRTGPYGKYRLQLEWQGAEQIDTEIYGGTDATATDPLNIADTGPEQGPINLDLGGLS